MEGKQTPKVEIRPMKCEDLDAVMDIERASFKTPWAKSLFVQELRDPSFSYFFVAEEQREIIGYGGFWLIVDEAHIGNLAVRTDRRRLGIGTLIVKTLLEKAREEGAVRATLEVRASNEPAQGLYGAFGFRNVGLRRRYYRDTDEDAIIMTCEFEKGPTG